MTTKALTSQVSTHGILVSWSVDASDAGANYNVQRSTDKTNWTTVATGVGSSPWEDTTGVAGTIYFYQVQADLSGFVSPWSPSSAGVVYPMIPDAPTLATATPNEAGILVAWTSDASDAGGTFNVYRNSGGGWGDGPLASGLSGSSWQDTNQLPANTLVNYQVTCVLNGFESAPSNSPDALWPDIPDAPTNVVGVAE